MTPSLESRLAEAGLSHAESARKQSLFDTAEQALVPQSAAPTGGVWRWFVPGRIEIFGKHTDYAGGRSLVCALERGFCVAAAPRHDALLCVTDALSGDRAEIPLSPDIEIGQADWTVYPRTVARRLARNFPGSLAGIEIAFASDLPRSAGLSSSSALLVAVFTALARRNRLENHASWRVSIPSAADLAGYLGAIESGTGFGSLPGGEGVGTFGGSEDHAAILCSRAGHAALFSFCPVRQEQTIPLPQDWVFAIGVSGVVAEKTGGARERYNRASLSSAAILALWRSATGRADRTLADAARSSPEAPECIREILRRASDASFSQSELLARFDQFFEENESLVPAAASALARGDAVALGSLAERSQAGAERGLRNQVPETIELAHLAREIGASAASAFGAGFGGSVWALVRNSEAAEFLRKWEKAYRGKFSGAAACEFFLTGAGPALLDLA